MGDKAEGLPDTSKESPTRSTDESKQSIDVLKSTKELADITNMDNLSVDTIVSEQKDEIILKKNPTSIETVYENVGMDKTISSEAPLHIVPDPPKELTNVLMHSSESGRMNKLRDHSSNIFPVGIMGCKEDATGGAISPRRFIDAHEASKDSIGHIENTPRKMQSAKINHNRNPLTGTGVDSSDEMKNLAGKRKDGNPVLGLGYETNKTANSSTRIPPGGFSHGLW